MVINFLFLFLFSFNLSAFELVGNPKKWSSEDFIGFDNIGDCESIGDISSVFTRIDNDKLFLRITFDDMYSRKNRIDNFQNNDLKMRVRIYNDSYAYFDEIIDISNIIIKGLKYDLLRSFQNNLIELKIDWPSRLKKEELKFNIDIVDKNKIVDSFFDSGNRNSFGGNVAFVHHGNQGLTYTQVFYGQEPIESSGFEEILEENQESNKP